MSDRMPVHGRTVCSTGSSSGMGRAIAEHLGAIPGCTGPPSTQSTASMQACEVNSRTTRSRLTSTMPGVFATNFSRNVGVDMMGMIAGMAGVENVERDDEGRVSRKMLAQLAANMSTTFGDVEDIARTVEFVITQPIHLNIEQLVIRPAKSLI